MKDSESLIMKTLMEQSDAEIKKLKKGKRRVEEQVDRDIADLFSEYKGISAERSEELKEKYRAGLIEKKTEVYDRALRKLEGVKAIIIGFYPQLS